MTTEENFTGFKDARTATNPTSAVPKSGTKKFPQKVSVTVHGTVYDSISKACKALKLEPAFVSIFRFKHPELNHSEIITRMLDDADFIKFQKTTMTCQGVTYQFIDEACIALDLNYNSTVKAIYQGLTLDDIVAEKKPIMVHGTPFKTRLEICKAFCLDFDSFRGYQKDHSWMTEEEIVDALTSKEGIKPVPRPAVVVNGAAYSSLRQACYATGINYSSAAWYRKQHPEIEIKDILEHYIKHRSNKTAYMEVDFRGQHFVSVRDACVACGINRSTFRYWCRKYGVGLSPSEALEKYVSQQESETQHFVEPEARHRKMQSYVINGVTYRSLNAVCSAFKIGVSQMKRSIRENPKLTVEDIVNKVVTGDLVFESTRTPVAVTVNGVDYMSVTDACRQLNLSFDTVQGYHKRHPDVPMSEILEKYVSNKIKYTKREVIVDGVAYPSKTAACRALGVNFDVCSQYRYYHPELTFEEAIKALLQHQDERTITVNGETFTSVKGVCEKYGMCAKSVYQYRARHPDLSTSEIMQIFVDNGGKFPRSKTYKVAQPDVKPAQAEVPKTETVARPQGTAPSEIVKDLETWRSASRVGKRTLVGVSTPEEYNKWVTESTEIISKETTSVCPDPVNAPWWKITVNVPQMVDQADADLIEVIYLYLVKKHPLIKVLSVCREDVTQTESGSAVTLQKENLALRSKINQLEQELGKGYCDDCGGVISEKFRQFHPGTHYCVNCFDKHH